MEKILHLKTDESKEKNYEFLFVVILFLAGVIAYFLIGNYSKSAYLYADEMLYTEIAKNIHNGKGIVIRGMTDYPFTKIGYPLLLSLCYFINDGVLRVKVIGLMNSAIMMSSVFPVWKTCCELKLDKKFKAIMLFITVLWPEMIFSTAFMSEILFCPLIALFIYLWVLNQRKKSISIACLMGAVGYMGYLVKEVFLSFIVCVVFFEVVYPILSYLFVAYQKGIRNLFKKYSKESLISLAAFLVSFIILNIIFNSLFFTDGNGYSGALKAENYAVDLYTLVFMVRCFFYYLSASLLSVMVLPVLYPVLAFRRISEESRKLFCFTLFYICINIAVIVLTISSREDLGNDILRVHSRYFGLSHIFLFIPFFSTIQSEIEKSVDNNGNENKNNAVLSWVVLVCVVLFIGFIFKGTRLISNVSDSQVLRWFYLLQAKFSTLTNGREGAMVIYLYSIIASAIVLVITGICNLLFSFRKFKACSYFFSGVMVVLCVINLYNANNTFKFHYKEDPALISEVQRLSDFFAGDEKRDNVVFITNNSLSNQSRCMDTYFVSDDNMYFVRSDLMINLVKDEPKTVSELTLYEPIWSYPFETVDSIDYIIVQSGALSGYGIANSEELSDLSTEHYAVYKNYDPPTICIEDETKFVGDDLAVSFASEGFNANVYVKSGISIPEGWYTWTEGDKMTVQIPVQGDFEKLYAKFDIPNSFGEQSFVLYQNGNEIDNRKINGAAEFSVELTPADGMLEFEVCFPEAKIVSEYDPNSSDNRKIALMLRKIIISAEP